jgi:hypothetical protein
MKRTNEDNTTVPGQETRPTKKPRLDLTAALPEFCLFITVMPECDEMLQLLRFRVASTPKASLIIKAIEDAMIIDSDSEDPWHTSEMFDYIYNMMDKRNKPTKAGKLVPAEIKALSQEEFGEWMVLNDQPDYEFGLIAPAANTAIFTWCSSF